MKHINFHSMWLKCFAFVFIMIVFPILVISFTAEKYNTNAMLEQKRLSDLKDLDSLAITTTFFLDSIECLGRLFADDDSTQNLFVQLKNPSFTSQCINTNDYFTSFLTTNNTICEISLMDPSGIFLGEEKLNRNRLSWFYNKTLLNDLPSVEKYWTRSFSIEYIEDHSTERVISFLQPCYKDKILLGYVVLFISTDTFNSFLTPFDYDTFILENSCVFASKQNIPFYLKLFQIYNINYGYLLEERSVILSSGTTPFVVTTRNYGKLDLQFVNISSYHTLKNSITVGFPGFYALSVYGTLFALISASILARQLTRPILNLKNIMTHVKSGDFDIRYHTTRKDEVAELGITFNSLLDTIQKLIYTLESNHKLQQKMQLQLIQEQVKPHFLYNMLEMINSMIRCNLKDDSINVVNNLAGFYRISLNNGSNIIKISQEIQLLKSYLLLQKMRYIEFMDYSLAFSPTIYEYRHLLNT